MESRRTIAERWEADEQSRVEPFLERRHRVMDQPAALADVEPHVIALGRDAVDVARGDADKPAQVRRPEFLEIAWRLAIGGAEAGPRWARKVRARSSARSSRVESTGFMR